MRLADLLARAASEAPDQAAAVFPGARLTYFELLRAAEELASELKSRGIGPGKRVAILSENSPAALTWFWGAQLAGATTVDLPALAGTPALASMIEESRPAELFASEKQRRRLDDAGIALNETLAIRAALRGDDHDVALIIYTSGTTGRPKGVMLSHHNLVSNVEAFNARLGLTREDSLLVVVPLYYIHGRIQLLTHTYLGATLYFSAGFQFPSVVLEELRKYSPSGFSGVPFHFATLLAQTKLSATALPNLRHLTITGGALSATQLEQLSAAVPSAKIHLNYGQTEASPRLTYLGPDELPRKPGSCGRALPGVTLEIIDGEVIASGAGIMKGYVAGDERQLEIIDERGRLHTGDLGRLDEEGYLYLSGRSSEMIKSAGERIFPREIEEVLDNYPGVAESAVLGVSDELLGEKIVALIVPHEPQEKLDLGALKQHCLKSLPFVRLPREVRVVESLPKTLSGKLSRAAIKELWRTSTYD